MTYKKNFSSFKKPAVIVYWLILATIIVVTMNKSLWKKPDKIFQNDIIHYYSYLPAAFIYHDLSLAFINKDLDRFTKHFWPLKGPKGNWVIVTTMGLSIMYAPFFLIVHYPLVWLGMDATGYSAPYQVALILSSIFYLAIGLLFLRRILERYFTQWVTAITLIAIGTATNIFFYVTVEPAMSHVYNFALMTAFLYYTIRWSEKPVAGYSIILGILTGLITLIRPTNILIIIVFIFWDTCSWRSLSDRIKLFVSRYYLLSVMILAAVLVWVPQMLYWKFVAGQYLYFSYGDKGKFFFTNPQVVSTLLGYRKGWLIYTPIMVFAFIGLYFLWKKYRPLFWPVIIFLVINIWVISSWWLWWYGGSFGLRAYIDSYGIMALPFAALVTWAYEKRHILVKSLVVLLLALFTFHNFFQIKQYETGAIDYVSMTREAYWDSFGHSKPSPRFPFLLSYPDYKSAEKGNYPDPLINPLYTGQLTRTEGIESIAKELRASPEQMASIRQKSIEIGISIDSMIYLDAGFIYDYKVSAGIIVPADK